MVIKRATKHFKVIYWIVLTILYIHTTFEYRLTNSLDTILMFYCFVIIPIGYAGHLILFEKTEK